MASSSGGGRSGGSRSVKQKNRAVPTMPSGNEAPF